MIGSVEKLEKEITTLSEEYREEYYGMLKKEGLYLEMLAEERAIDQELEAIETDSVEEKEPSPAAQKMVAKNWKKNLRPN